MTEEFKSDSACRHLLPKKYQSSLIYSEIVIVIDENFKIGFRYFAITDHHFFLLPKKFSNLPKGSAKPYCWLDEILSIEIIHDGAPFLIEQVEKNAVHVKIKMYQHRLPNAPTVSFDFYTFKHGRMLPVMAKEAWMQGKMRYNYEDPSKLYRVFAEEVEPEEWDSDYPFSESEGFDDTAESAEENEGQTIKNVAIEKPFGGGRKPSLRELRLDLSNVYYKGTSTISSPRGSKSDPRSPLALSARPSHNKLKPSLKNSTSIDAQVTERRRMKLGWNVESMQSDTHKGGKKKKGIKASTSLASLHIKGEEEADPNLVNDAEDVPNPELDHLSKTGFLDRKWNTMGGPGSRMDHFSTTTTIQPTHISKEYVDQIGTLDGHHRLRELQLLKNATSHDEVLELAKGIVSRRKEQSKQKELAKSTLTTKTRGSRMWGTNNVGSPLKMTSDNFMKTATGPMIAAPKGDLNTWRSHVSGDVTKRGYSTHFKSTQSLFMDLRTSFLTNSSLHARSDLLRKISRALLHSRSVKKLFFSSEPLFCAFVSDLKQLSEDPVIRSVEDNAESIGKDYPNHFDFSGSGRIDVDLLLSASPEPASTVHQPEAKPKPAGRKMSKSGVRKRSLAKMAKTKQGSMPSPLSGKVSSHSSPSASPRSQSPKGSVASSRQESKSPSIFSVQSSQSNLLHESKERVSVLMNTIQDKHEVVLNDQKPGSTTVTISMMHVTRMDRVKYANVILDAVLRSLRSSLSIEQRSLFVTSRASGSKEIVLVDIVLYAFQIAGKYADFGSHTPNWISGIGDNEEVDVDGQSDYFEDREWRRESRTLHVLLVAIIFELNCALQFESAKSLSSDPGYSHVPTFNTVLAEFSKISHFHAVLNGILETVVTILWRPFPMDYVVILVHCLQFIVWMIGQNEDLAKQIKISHESTIKYLLSDPDLTIRLVKTLPAARDAKTLLKYLLDFAGPLKVEADLEMQPEEHGENDE